MLLTPPESGSDETVVVLATLIAASEYRRLVGGTDTNNGCLYLLLPTKRQKYLIGNVKIKVSTKF